MQHARYQLLEDHKLKDKVRDTLGKIQEKLLSEETSLDDKNRMRSQKKGIKHQARVEPIRKKINGAIADRKGFTHPAKPTRSPRASRAGQPMGKGLYMGPSEFQKGYTHIDGLSATSPTRIPAAKSRD